MLQSPVALAWIRNGAQKLTLSPHAVNIVTVGHMKPSLMWDNLITAIIVLNQYYKEKYQNNI